MKTNRKKIGIGAALILVTVLLSVILYEQIGKPMTSLVQNTERLRLWVVEKGWASRLIYMGMVCLQVLIAVIPGEPLELAAGYVFGALEGTLIALGGIALGSMMVFGLVRRFGMKLVRVFFSQEKIDSLRGKLNNKRLFWIIAVLMILPGTPKDLLTYCAGLTTISWSTWLVISTVGRIPSVLTSTWGGHAIAQRDYLKAGLIFGVTTLLCVAGLYIFSRIKEHKEEKNAPNKKNPTE